MNFCWAEKYPDLLKICTLFNLNELSNPVRLKYTPVESILQDGPQCGLVALAMCFEKPTKQLVNEIMHKAKSLNYSSKGEIFSAKYMWELARNYLKNKLVYLHDGPLNSDSIKEFLFNGGFILVPYDCDKNHTPTIRNGHKAHWALITGALESQNGKTFVLARHGKSRHIAVWDLADLDMSNSQLYDYPKEEAEGYVIPESGLNSPEGLINKAILICNKV